MIRLKQKLNEFRWSLNNLQQGTIQSELYQELFGVLDTLDKEDDQMIKQYNPNKKVTLQEVTGAFIHYTTSIDLTRSEYLLVHNVFDVVMERLNRDGDVE